MAATELWVMVGLAGQALFGARFFVQWLASERAGASVVPALFWYLSLPAGLILLAYAIWREDPVFIINEMVCVAIFARNIAMVRRPRRHSACEVAERRRRAAGSAEQNY